MRLFLDSADRDALGPLLATGLFSGVTTNPTLLARAGVTVAQLPEMTRWLREHGAEQVFLQVWGATTEDLLRCAGQLLERCGDVHIKIPVTEPGIVAARSLESAGVRTLLTGVYSAVQVVPAMVAGATYLAPYLGRMDDAGLDGLEVIRRMQAVIDRTGSPTRLLVASVRTPRQLVELGLGGVRDVTIAPALWETMVSEPLTDAAVDVFDADIRTLLD